MEVMGLNIGLPEAIVIGFYANATLRASFNHGKKSVPTILPVVNTLCTVPLALAFGGFFGEFGWPQFIYAGLYSLTVFAAINLIANGAGRWSKVDAPRVIAFTGALLGLYYWGGFFA